MALPTALAGIVWILFGTGTTLSVPALTGAIMCMGVATANSILVISFARERMAAGANAMAAAFEAWRRYDSERQLLMRNELEAIASGPGLSANLYEMVTKMLG